MGYILNLCGWYPSKLDKHSGDFVQRHAIAIATQKKTVVLFAKKNPDPAQKSIEQRFKQDGYLFEYIFYYPKRKWFDKFWSQYYYMKVLKQFLPQMLKEHGAPDLVHVNIVWRAANWALYLKRKYGWKFVITENSTEYHSNAKGYVLKKDAFRQSVTRNAFRKSLMFIPVSAQLARTVQELYGYKMPVTVVANAVNTKLFYLEKKKVDSNIFKLVHVSTMGYQKNIDGIIRTLKLLADITENLQIILIGPATSEVRGQIENHTALQRNTTFTGNIPYEDVAANIRQADGLFLFSRYENLPCVILEALCCGVPVISSDVGGVSEVINESNGELVASEDETALLSALQRLVRREKKYNYVEIAAKATARYNYKQIGKDFMQAYENIYQPPLK